MNYAPRSGPRRGVHVKQVPFVDAKAEQHNRSLPHSHSITAAQITLRLGVTFGLLVALLITIGDLGMRRMERINDDLHAMMGKQWTKLRLAQEAVTYSNRNSRITMEIFLLKDKGQIDYLLITRAENTKKISSLVVDLENLCGSKEEKELLGFVKDARLPYLNSYTRALHLL